MDIKGLIDMGANGMIFINVSFIIKMIQNLSA